MLLSADVHPWQGFYYIIRLLVYVRYISASWSILRHLLQVASKCINGSQIETPFSVRLHWFHLFSPQFATPACPVAVLGGGEHIYVPITVFLGFMEGTHWWPLSCIQFCLFRRIHPWYGYLSFISLPGSLLNVGRIAGPVLSHMFTGGQSFGI